MCSFFNHVSAIGDVFRQTEILFAQQDRQALPLELPMASAICSRSRGRPVKSGHHAAVPSVLRAGRSRRILQRGNVSAYRVYPDTRGRTPCQAVEERSAISQPVHQRLFLTAVDFDHRPIDEMHQWRSQHRHQVGDLGYFGNAPERN